jgi:short-subunit dehydrogenase
METVLKENGSVDVLVNNAGHSLFGSLEELSFEEIRGQFETNFFGVVRTCKAVIPTMRKPGSGTIIIIGSLGGRIGLLPFLTQYPASKFALEGFTESLRQELAEFGINVVLIEPGTIRTNFENNTKTAKNYKPESSPYANGVQKLFEGVQSITANSSHPRGVAEVVLKVVNTPNPNVRYHVGKDAESVLIVVIAVILMIGMTTQGV